MKSQLQFISWRTVLVSYMTLACSLAMQGQKKSKYACDEPQPENLCNAANTCGSPTSACTINITRSSSSSNVKPDIPNAKNNQFFCIKTGTKVVWTSPKKNTGFMVSFGTDSPFDPDDPIMGGGQKPVTTTAVTPGCYKYDAGAFTSGTIYGMGSGGKPELVILP